MSKIKIVDLEVFYCVGVSDEERAAAQRLLLTIDLSFDFSSAAISDRIEKTIDYHALIQELIRFGDGRSWKLIERLATSIADKILNEFKPQAVMVEVKKFPVREVHHVSVSVTKTRGQR